VLSVKRKASWTAVEFDRVKVEGQARQQLKHCRVDSIEFRAKPKERLAGQTTDHNSEGS
jgi:hypothetical protein